jgi:hypothetical protein
LLDWEAWAATSIAFALDGSTRLARNSFCMSHEADFYAAKAIDRPFQQIQAIGTKATWNWEMADLDRFMAYSVVSTNSGVSVTVEETSVCQTSGGTLSVNLVVRVDPFDRGATGSAPLNFFAVRIPPI